MDQGLESKKQQFKTFLQRTGAIDQISKILVKMFDEPQRPTNALNFVLDYLGVPQSQNVDAILKQFEAEQLENIRLRAEIAKIKKQIDQQKGL